jgi:BirA family biotin operon repressor/biotin-[acetyl-CoA-carboxylase] ligase
MPTTTSARSRTFASSTHVIALDEIDSTNTEAARHAARGAQGPLWITARRQSHGKGRSGRSFHSPAGGNLYASLLLTLVAPADRLPQMSLLAGVAGDEAIRAACGPAAPPGLRLKWPNDILIGDAKLCGILTESTAGTGDGKAATMIIGWGINLATHPASLDRPTTSLAAHGARVAPEGMLDCLDAAFFRWLDIWAGGDGFGSVRTAWLERAGAVGERLILNAGDGAMEGRFIGLDDDGALLLADAAGQARRVTYGDVALPEPMPAREGRLRD